MSKNARNWRLVDERGAIFLGILVFIGIVIYGLGFHGLGKIVISIGTALLTVILGLWVYFEQKRSERLFELYFKNTFLTIIEDVDEGMRRCNHAFLVFQEFVNVIRNSIKQKVVDSEHFLKNLNDLRTRIPELAKFHDASKFRLEEIGFEEYLFGWIDKSDEDFEHFLEKINGQMGILINDFSIHPYPRNTDKDEEIIKYVSNDLQRYYRLVQRHYILIKLFSEVLSLYTESNFASRRVLLKLLKTKEMKKINEKIKEVYYSLFAYYKTENEGVIYTYAKDNSGRNFKIEKKDSGYFVKSEKIDEKTMSCGILPVKNDEDFINAKVEGNPNFNLHRELIGIANKILYEKPPKFVSFNF